MVSGRSNVGSMPARVLAVAVALLSLPVAGAGGQERPLPDAQAFLQETRRHLEVDSTLQSSYVYVETRRALKLDKNGRTTDESVRVLESYPGLPGEERWERLISEDGKPVSASELAEQDRERQRKAEAMARRLTTQPQKEQARQQRDYQKYRREIDEIIDDIFVIFDVKMTRRERIEGHDTIAFTLTPKPSARPRTREGSQMKKFLVHAWISESDHELVKLDAEAIDNVSFGMGLLARLHKGAQLSFLRRKINGEVWLPAVMAYRASARVGLLFSLRRSGTSEFSGYRKFSVETNYSTRN